MVEEKPFLGVPSPGEDVGIAAGGTTTTLTDQNKGWGRNQWVQALVTVMVDGILYTTNVSGNTSTTLTFATAIPVNVKAHSPYRLKSVTTQVASGQTRPGIALNPNQQIVDFVYVPQDQVTTPYAISWVQPELAAGSMHQLYNIDTGLLTPYDIPAGYKLSIIEERHSFNQDSEAWIYFDGLLVANAFEVSALTPVDRQNLVKFSTTLLDPTSSSAHTLDYQVINTGSAAMKGGITITTILESVNTPPFPTRKDTGCPFCAAVNNVPVHTTTIVCSNCGKTYYVSDSTVRRRI